MKKYLYIIPITIVLIFFSRYLIFTTHIIKPNPLSYYYNAPINQVREIIFSTFSEGKYHGLDFKVGFDSLEREVNKIRGNQNENHFFINWFGWFSSGEDSKIYYNWWGKLKLIPSYHIILDSVSQTQTKITIESFPKVKAGVEFSLNHGLPYFTSNKVSVKPSTIEEYEIIKLLGSELGENNMPPVEEP